MTFRGFRRLAGFLGLAAAAAAVALAIRGSARPIILNQSLATLSAVVASATASILLTRISFLTESQWGRFLERWRTLTPPTGFQAASFIVVVVAFCLHNGLAGAQRPYKNKDYIDDERDYLRVAEEMESLPGGVLGLLPSLFRGEFAEDNRHPVYPALLAFGRQVRVFDRALIQIPELLSTSFGLFVVLTTAVIAWKMFGPVVGALSALLVATNGAMIQASSLIACETLLVLLTTLGWYAFASSKTPMSRPRALLLGGLFGLAYLTKASALFPLLIIIGLTAWRQSDEPRWRAPALMTLAFIVVASPLLARNVVRYHNPLHSFNNKLLFADSYDAGIAEPDLGAVGNLKRYLSRHAAKEVVVDRFLAGLTWETFVLLRSLGPWPFDSGRVLIGGVLLLAAILGMVAEIGRKLSPFFLLLWTAWFLLFFGWYQPIASGDRFLLPLAPPLTIAASLGLTCAIKSVAVGVKNRARPLATLV